VSRGVLCEFIVAEKKTYGVRRLCRVLGISPTTFYAWAANAHTLPTGRAREESPPAAPASPAPSAGAGLPRPSLYAM
jgi:hypothetical protein